MTDHANELRRHARKIPHPQGETPGVMQRAADEIERLRARIERMEQQEPVAWRTFDGEGGYDYRSYEDNENYKLGWDARNPNHIGWVEPLYALPGAQPAPSVPIDSIGKLLTQAMDVAVANGANSVSMPDELVEVAAWLAAAPKPEGE